MKAGHVYILTNPGLEQNVYKVGYTMENLVRLEKINQRGYAGLFGGYSVAYKRPCQDARLCEQVILDFFAKERVSSDLELVRIDLQKLINKLDEVCKDIDGGDVGNFSKYSMFNSKGRKIKKYGKILFENNITFNLIGCFIPAKKIDTKVTRASSNKYLIETNSWSESYEAIKKILKDNNLKMTGDKKYTVMLLKQEIYLIDRKYMMQDDAPVTKLGAIEKYFMEEKRKCFEVKDACIFSFIPELQDSCTLEVTVNC